MYIFLEKGQKVQNVRFLKIKKSKSPKSSFFRKRAKSPKRTFLKIKKSKSPKSSFF
jgi:hypothetical protein